MKDVAGVSLSVLAVITVRSHFFFQAEDGIRAGRVTGVQTCALPIYGRAAAAAAGTRHPVHLQHRAVADRADRSEERRVGKECRSPWWWLQEKKKRILATSILTPKRKV